MNEIAQYVLILSASFVLGSLFFGGLWFTLKKLVTAKNPAWLIFGSFVVRTGIALLGFYYVAQFGWKAMLLALLGFIAARFMVMYFAKKYDEKENLLK